MLWGGTSTSCAPAPGVQHHCMQLPNGHTQHRQALLSVSLGLSILPGLSTLPAFEEFVV